MTKEKILVVEDNRLNMKLVKSLLVLGGYTVLEAYDARAGLELARQGTSCDMRRARTILFLHSICL